MKRKSERQRLIKNCDDVLCEIVRRRDKYTCQRCERSAEDDWKMEVSHFYGRSNLSVRHEFDNVVLLCFSCHYRWAHSHPLEFGEWWQKRLGKERMDMLILKKNLCFTGDLKLILFALKMRLKEREDSP